ncbi:MAG: RNA-protein complex protein Nop10 [Thermoplasmata archaeon]|nr:RNA-protein complex protein Nop10 [Thermoplasmata archaeon]MBR4243861.1 RNA-protein complex protein Nop10 [Candidatus Methanomethylophilaceae archaeon]MBR6214578.1 RNA-protein complex protein Nop10 [Candidatus Methanomethylophilaceae archaeon]
MKSEIRKCNDCARYTLSMVCPICGKATVNPIPPRYSPEDRMGEYRRKAILEEYGENGKHHNV